MFHNWPQKTLPGETASNICSFVLQEFFWIHRRKYLLKHTNEKFLYVSNISFRYLATGCTFGDMHYQFQQNLIILIFRIRIVDGNHIYILQPERPCFITIKNIFLLLYVIPTICLRTLIGTYRKYINYIMNNKRLFIILSVRKLPVVFINYMKIWRSQFYSLKLCRRFR